MCAVKRDYFVAKGLSVTVVGEPLFSTPPSLRRAAARVGARKMGFLRALESRLEEDRDGDDGYYVRTHDNRKIGPMDGMCARHASLILRILCHDAFHALRCAANAD